MGVKRDRRRHAMHSQRVRQDPRWPALRLQVLRRDGWRCVRCGRRNRLEVDHVTPVRDAPERAFEPANLQVLCRTCHSRKTRLEVGAGEPNPEREKWKDLVKVT